MGKPTKIILAGSLGLAVLLGIGSYLSFARFNRLQSLAISDDDVVDTGSELAGTIRGGVRAYDGDRYVLASSKEALSGYRAGRLKVLTDYEYAMTDEGGRMVFLVRGANIHQAVRDGYHFADYAQMARASLGPPAEERALLLMQFSWVFAALAAGLGAYRVLRMVLDRFVTSKWSCLVAGLACLLTGVLLSGFVLSLVELSKLPKVQPATRSA